MGVVVTSTGGFVVSTTFWSRPDKRCQTNQPIAKRSEGAQQPRQDRRRSRWCSRGIFGARSAYVIENPRIAKIFGEPGRQGTGNIALLRGQKIGEARGIETSIALFPTKDTQNDRPKKAHQAFRAACVGTCILSDCAGQSGQCLATKKRREDAATLVNQRLLTGLTDDAGQTRQHSGLLFPHDLGQFGCALWFGNIRNKGSKKRWHSSNDCLLGGGPIEAKRRSDARDDVRG